MCKYTCEGLACIIICESLGLLDIYLPSIHDFTDRFNTFSSTGTNGYSIHDITGRLNSVLRPILTSSTTSLALVLVS
eukprot:COSAG02_NODE_15376_length_1176_cov_1.548747_2_plen_76_part_01